MKKENKFLLIGMFWYTLPIILFGDFNHYYKYLLLMVSMVAIYYYWYYRIPKNNNWYSSILSASILGITLSFFNLNPFLFDGSNKTIFSISFTYANIIGYWISLISPIITSTIYHEHRRERIKSEFGGDEKRISREEKINSIIKKF
jgi:hypothetical protein